MKSDGSVKNPENEGFEHAIKYDNGINSDFVLASCSVPVNYDYTRLNVQTRNWPRNSKAIARLKTIIIHLLL